MTRTDRNSSFTVQGVGQARQAPSTQPTSLSSLSNPVAQKRPCHLSFICPLHGQVQSWPSSFKAKKSKSKSQSANPKKSRHHTAVPLTPSLRMQASSLRLAQTELERDGSLQKISPPFYCQRWKVSGYFIKIYTRHLPFYFPIYSVHLLHRYSAETTSI